MISTLPYRLGVGLVIINDESKIFTGLRLDSSKAWQMPQGGIDDNEIPLEAAYREMLEETGIEKSKVVLRKQSKNWYRYDLPKEIQGKFWGGRYRGQSQKWFLFQFNGIDADINIETKDQEFSDWKWSKKSDMLESIVPFKKSLYKSVLTDFGLHLRN
jgi:putative (di)nucleoside polyphosphate hydrolase